jgi:hypothetical protein
MEKDEQWKKQETKMQNVVRNLLVKGAKVERELSRKKLADNCIRLGQVTYERYGHNILLLFCITIVIVICLEHWERVWGDDFGWKFAFFVRGQNGEVGDKSQVGTFV